VTEVFQAAAELQAVCQSQAWKFCFIGGLALQRWGEPRETADADLTLLTGFGGEAPFIRILLEHFAGRIPDAAQFALDRRVLLLRSRRGVGLDIALGALPFEALAVERSSEFEYLPGIVLRTCSAEDLVVMKAFAGRGQDWVDVERIIVRQTGRLDWAYVQAQLGPLAELKGSPETMELLARRRAEFEQ
jgi:hypothetical protein